MTEATNAALDAAIAMIEQHRTAAHDVADALNEALIDENGSIIGNPQHDAAIPAINTAYTMGEFWDAIYATAIDTANEIKA